ncbi:GTP-binding protein [Moraxella bovis]|uniref:amidase family protein n=1 Tax=Moraxella bovis TaxID=476 RepID=UPI00222713DB|nr:amidase family protein [Moraxella bovis]UYZ68336.1 GTP-binding protein [Moraxella bovis]UYZ73359.1 GTP-binding protein [Moraxella bovis]UZA14017.1 GTP-binding protein [Moraxella bovis]UZA27627.1 GTP-binding protein [Moraxella bovis]UZA37835.1 GTP-binding protein [Moraxella bovis]
MTALDLAHAYATGDTCPIKVLDTLYDHIDDAPNAFISLTKELAYAQAQSAKIRWQRGNPLSIFDGIPIAYKDLFDIKQTITTAGAKLRMHAPPATQDAHVVSTLHHMGLTCVGKTNLSEFAYSGLRLNPHFGTPTNVTLFAKTFDVLSRPTFFLKNEQDTHAHAQSLVLTFDTPIDWLAFGLWLSLLLDQYGEHILRLKGVLHLQGIDKPMLLQGVQHCLYPPEHLPASIWQDDVTRLIMIVRGLDASDVERSAKTVLGYLNTH